MADPRQLLKDSWVRLSVEHREELERLVMDAWTQTLNATKHQVEKGVYECRGCGKQNLVEVRVEVADIVTRAKAFEIYANQAFGKPQETRTVTVNVGEQTLEALERMSTRELAEMAGLEIVDGEFVEVGAALELPPAA